MPQCEHNKGGEFDDGERCPDQATTLITWPDHDWLKAGMKLVCDNENEQTLVIDEVQAAGGEPAVFHLVDISESALYNGWVSISVDQHGENSEHTHTEVVRSWRPDNAG
jgi:hypothetical protein